MKEMLHIVDPHELCEDLVVVDTAGPTVHQPEMILHVDKSRCAKSCARSYDLQLLRD